MLQLMIRNSILGYVFFISWTAAFALGEWLLLPFLFVISAMVFVTIKLLVGGGVSCAPYKKEDYLILLFLVAFTISHLINQNASGFNYIFAYCFVFCILYLFIKGVLFSYVTARQLYMVNTWAVIFIGIFLSANFVLNIAGVIDLQGMMPRTTETNATYLGVFNRGYAFATEPGTIAFYMNALGPLALWYLWSGVRVARLIKLILTAVLFFGWLVLFSASGWAFLSVALVISLVISGIKKYINSRMIKTIGVIFFIVIPVLFMVASSPKVQNYFNPIYLKLTLAEDASTSSSGSRIDRWSTGIDLVFEEPFFGKGPRYFSSKGESSVLSWYLMVLVEGGFISFLAILIFLGSVLIRILKFRHPSRFPVLVGFLAGSGHLLVISTFFEPFLWLLIAIFYVQQAKYQRHQKYVVYNIARIAG